MTDAGPTPCRISDGKLPRREHILKTKEFGQVYKKGRSVRRGPLVMYCMPNGLTHRRIGFSISSRSVKRATRRNRIRRCLKEAYRLSRDRLLNGIDLVFVVKSDPGKGFAYCDYLKMLEACARLHKIML